MIGAVLRTIKTAAVAAILVKVAQDASRVAGAAYDRVKREVATR